MNNEEIAREIATALYGTGSNLGAEVQVVIKCILDKHKPEMDEARAREILEKRHFIVKGTIYRKRQSRDDPEINHNPVFCRGDCEANALNSTALELRALVVWMTKFGKKG